jgi:hypothetical protein
LLLKDTICYGVPQGLVFEELRLIEFSVLGLLGNFLSFLYESLVAVPLELSIGGVVLLTFFWAVNEIFGRLYVWRSILMTVWGLLIFDYFVPMRDMSRGEIWLVVLAMGTITMIAGRKIHRVMDKNKIQLCPHCGAQIAPAQHGNKQPSHPTEYLTPLPIQASSQLVQDHKLRD